MMEDAPCFNISNWPIMIYFNNKSKEKDSKIHHIEDPIYRKFNHQFFHLYLNIPFGKNKWRRLEK